MKAKYFFCSAKLCLAITSYHEKIYKVHKKVTHRVYKYQNLPIVKPYYTSRVLKYSP